jgi:membrane-bound lytic murein transglycosylase D
MRVIFRLLLTGLIVLSLAGCAINGSFGKATGNAKSKHEKNRYSRAGEIPHPGLEDANAVCGPGMEEEQDYEPAPDLGEARPRTSLKEAQRMLDKALEYCDEAQEKWEKGDLDLALDALDQASELLLKIEIPEGDDLFQQKEDIRFTIARRTLEIYASRQTATTGAHDAIPMDMNSHVEAEIRSLTGPERNFFTEAYRRSGLYRSYIVERFKAAGVPEELSWLPLIESGFKDRAMSVARALGMWQFIASTGYKYGLDRNRFVDERMDFEKSTQAAIEYLKELHQIFGDWATCLAAYNCGEGRVLRVIRTQNINYLDNFWDLYTKLPQETARYVPRFLATLHIVKNPEKYGIDLGEPYAALDFEKVTINKQVHLRDVASALAVPESSLVSLNSELRYQVTPSEPYELRVPAGKGETLTARLDELRYCPVQERPEKEAVRGASKKGYITHKVRKGETLSKIACRYGVSPSEIAEANRLNKKKARIAAGQTLKIPKGGKGYVASVDDKDNKTPAKVVTRKKPVTHKIKRGDSLWNIARRYGTTVKAIQKANGMKSRQLTVGQALTIPVTREAESEEAKTQVAKTGKKQSKLYAQKSKVYVVKGGDSPHGIARRHNMTVDRFLRLNKFRGGTKIYPGQKVYVE